MFSSGLNTANLSSKLFSYLTERLILFVCNHCTW